MADALDIWADALSRLLALWKHERSRVQFLGTVVLFMILGAMTPVPFFGGMARYLLWVLWVYVGFYLQDLATHVARGRQEIPMWPDISDLSGVVVPSTPYALAMVVPLVPGLFGDVRWVFLFGLVPALVLTLMGSVVAGGRPEGPGLAAIGMFFLVSGAVSLANARFLFYFRAGVALEEPWPRAFISWSWFSSQRSAPLSRTKRSSEVRAVGGGRSLFSSRRTKSAVTLVEPRTISRTTP